MYDLIIRNGTIVDGTGADARRGDVAVKDGKIVAVGGQIEGEAAETVDADGKLVTPGFVDIHTHYDGQATWDDVLDPSAGHGVTTVVAGNCGVGFAPVHPGQEEWLIQLMEGVEDIPGTALAEGMSWNWETFPEYLDVLDARHYAIDIGTQVAHGAVRGYVMGERGAKNEPATPEDIEARWPPSSRRPSRPGPWASRPRAPSPTGPWTASPSPAPTPPRTSCSASAGRWARSAGACSSWPRPPSTAWTAADPFKEIDWMRRLGAEIERPVSFALLQLDPAPELWRQLMDLVPRGHRGRRRPPPAGRLPALRPAHRPPDQPRLPEAADLHGAWPTCPSTSWSSP